MSSLNSVEKTGLRRISVLLSPIKSSDTGSISISEILENEKKILRKYDLFDKKLLSPEVKEVKSFEKARRSLFVSKEGKKLEAFDVASSNSQQNGSNTDENKKPVKKINPLKIRISRSSNFPGKFGRASTICSLSGGNSLVLKDIAVENELKNSKRQSNVSKKKKEINMVPGKDSEGLKKTKKSSFASKERRKLEALEVASDNSRQNVSNTNENQKVEKKVDSLKTRIACSSTSPRKLGRDSTMLSLRGGKSLVLKDIAVENELKNSNKQSGKTQSYASKKKKATNMVPGQNSDLEGLKKTKKSSLASKKRKTLDALDEVSVNSRQNISNTYGNKNAEKKIDLLKRRISCSSTSSRKLKRVSTTYSLSGEKPLVLKDIAVENEAELFSNKKGKRLSYVSKKTTNMVPGKDFDLEEYERTKSASNRAATMKERNKENYEFESESETETMSVMERGKRNADQAKAKSVARKVPIDFSLEPAEILRSKYKTLYLDRLPKCNDDNILKSTSLQQENTELKKKEGMPTRKSVRIARIEKVKVHGTPARRRSIRIAAMERNRFQIT